MVESASPALPVQRALAYNLRLEVSMKIPHVPGAAALTCGLLLLAAPSFAHHSFDAEFDAKRSEILSRL